MTSLAPDVQRMTVYLLQVGDHLIDVNRVISCPCGRNDYSTCDNRTTLLCSVYGDTTRLLAMANAILVLHQPKTVVVRTLCGAHDLHDLGSAEGQAAVNGCPDCAEHERVACAECDPICPDDNIWPCKTVRVIIEKLLGKEESGDAS